MGARGRPCCRSGAGCASAHSGTPARRAEQTGQEKTKSTGTAPAQVSTQWAAEHPVQCTAGVWSCAPETCVISFTSIARYIPLPTKGGLPVPTPKQQLSQVLHVARQPRRARPLRGQPPAEAVGALPSRGVGNREKERVLGRSERKRMAGGAWGERGVAQTPDHCLHTEQPKSNNKNRFPLFSHRQKKSGPRSHVNPPARDRPRARTLSQRGTHWQFERTLTVAPKTIAETRDRTRDL